MKRVNAADRRPGQAPVAPQAGHLVFADQEVQTLGVLGNNAILARLHGGPVQRGSSDAANPKLRSVLQVIPDLGVEQERLGGNTAHMKARSTQPVRRLDQRYLQPVLAGPKCRCITPWTAAQNRHIKDCLCHTLLHSSPLANS